MSEKTKSSWFNWHQANVLSERYLDIILGDFGSTFLFIVQAPLIAFAITFAWKYVGHATATLHFILIISAVWFGCINACKEIVKEKAIYQRERMFDLNILSYVYSKVKILSMFSFIQCFLLLVIINYNLTLKGNLILFFCALFLSSFAGSVMGLILSAIVNSPDKAVMLAPVLTIPQIIFSGLIIDEKYLKGAVAVVEKLMISKWGYQALEELSKNEPVYTEIATAFLVLIGFSVVYFVITGMILKARDNHL